ncbi:MAG: hypothetical protein ACRD2B_12295 [Terriglobia bacterium]
MANATSLLTVVSSANAELSCFLEKALGLSLDSGSADIFYRALEGQLPAIARAIERTGSVLSSSPLPEKPDAELSAQVDLYLRNLQRIKGLLPGLLAGAEARRNGLQAEGRRIGAALSWSGAIKLIALDGG